MPSKSQPYKLAFQRTAIWDCCALSSPKMCGSSGKKFNFHFHWTYNWRNMILGLQSACIAFAKKRKLCLFGMDTKGKKMRDAKRETISFWAPRYNRTCSSNFHGCLFCEPINSFLLSRPDIFFSLVKERNIIYLSSVVQTLYNLWFLERRPWRKVWRRKERRKRMKKRKTVRDESEDGI